LPFAASPEPNPGDARSQASGTGAFVALVAVSRLLAVAPEDGLERVGEALVREARTCFGAGRVLLVEPEAGRRLRVLAGDPAPGLEHEIRLSERPGLADLLDRRVRLMRLDGARAAEVRSLMEGAPPGPALLMLLRERERDTILVLAGLDPERELNQDVAAAFADAGAAALARVHAVEEHARQVAQQQALTRAATTLNESLDLDTVLARICQEAATILDAEIASVYRGSSTEPQSIAATFGLPPETVGYTLPLGAGLAGKVAVQGRAMLTNDYQRIAGLPEASPFNAFLHAMAAPMRWDGELRGVLSIGYTRPMRLGQDDLHLLETFAELAAVACANASAHAGLAQAARTDGLTGCLNHAALHDSLAREIERSLRHESAPLSLVLVDLDHFKQVNEAHGHLVGDEVLRRAGHALRHSLRPYDIAARYGGDEFALVVTETGEADACDIARRALARLADGIGELRPPGASAGTAGVAEWSPGVSVTELVARADRALLHAKQEGHRGAAFAFSQVPDHFRPGRFARHDRHLPEPPPMTPVDRDFPARQLDDRLRKRTRQLAAANALGARLAPMTDVQEVLEAAVDELHRAFGYFCVAMIRLRPDARVEAAALRGAPFLRLLERHWSQPADEGLIGRCLRERRPVLVHDVTAEPEYVGPPETADVRSELVVPLWVGDELWGAINVEEREAGAFDEEDLLLLQTVADQVGAAMRSAQLYQRLERAYLGTAEALAAALEAKDAYTAAHARSIVELAEEVGRRLGMSEDALRDLRFGAVFHDIGKIAVPEAILNKPGPLDAQERTVMERHTVVGEQILAPVEFLENVRRLVRHEHERWDGLGYPDGLAGTDIPLGARIILACDAFHAMTTDRPYRRAMTPGQAAEELRRHAGTQFDPDVIDALLDVVSAPEPAMTPAPAPVRDTLT
jgi:diguanylate cyclase (GGDEF)-like protein/putative nucleotidyltransferase with HDIG domain